MSKFIKISMVLLAFALLSTSYVSAKEKCCDKDGKGSEIKTCDCKECENCKCGCKEGKECKCKSCKDCKCGCKGDKECDCKKGDCKKSDCKKGEKSGCGCKDKDAKKGHDDCPHKKQHYDGK
ncbi:MAG TPA: hypothetical protein PLI61_13130 [bacterium]|nr:hypothetical protein [bacterium]